MLVTKDFPWGGFCSNQILDYLFISFPVGRVLMTEAEARTSPMALRERQLLRSRLPVSSQAGTRKSLTVLSSGGLQKLPTVSRSCFSFSLVGTLASIRVGSRETALEISLVCFL